MREAFSFVQMVFFLTSSQSPGVVGVICTDAQGLALAGKGLFTCCVTSLLTLARGTLKQESAGLVSGLVSQANFLKLGTDEDEKPTIVLEFDTGLVN